MDRKGYEEAYFYLEPFSEADLSKMIKERTTPQQRKEMLVEYHPEITRWRDLHHVHLTQLLRDVMTDEELAAYADMEKYGAH